MDLSFEIFHQETDLVMKWAPPAAPPESEPHVADWRHDLKTETEDSVTPPCDDIT